MGVKVGQLISAKYSVWQSSLFGASAIAFGVGVILSDKINITAAWAIIVIGVFIHSWGMYKMYKRKRG